MRFPPHFLDDIRARIPISQVVGRKVAWDKRKSNAGRGDLWACCPFHGEKTPSFHVEDRKGRYHCFGCGVSGDHFTFLVEQEGLSFPDAVAQLAAEAGLSLPARDAEAEKRDEQRASLHEVVEKAAQFFEAALQTGDGGKARAYLRERGLAPEIQRRFRIGYAPAGRNALKEHLANAGITQEQMIEAGLLVSGDDIPVSYDRFRDRVMFPITDLRGRVIAFGGRALSADAQAKYLNSPDTPLFSKGRVLYNGQAARAALRKGGHLVVVEGYIDVIACVAAGFEATVAPLGTALTEDQLRLLWQMADEPILCFDGDAAGVKAADRASEMVTQLPKEKSARFASLPDGLDPDELIRKGGAKAFEQVLEAALPLSQMIIAREIRSVDLTIPEQRAAFETRLYAVAASISDPVVARHYRDFFRLRMSEIFWGADGRRKSGKKAVFAAHRNAPRNIVDRIIVGLCVEEPRLFTEHYEDLLQIEFADEDHSEFFRRMYDLLLEYDAISVTLIYKRLGRRFFKTLTEVHGAPTGLVVAIQGGEELSAPKPSAGERLRIMLPVIRLQPEFALLEQTLQHFVLVRRERIQESEIEASLKRLSDDGRLESSLKGLQDLRTMVAESERELDIPYQRLRFRPANDNSLGQMALDGDPMIKRALRAIR